MQELKVSKGDVLEYARLCRDAPASLVRGGERRQSLRDWLVANGEGVPVLRNLDLRCADLRFGDFSGIRVEGCRFEGADVSHASFRQAAVPGSRFDRIMAVDADFAGADLRRCRFTGAKLLGHGPPAMDGRRHAVDFTGAGLTGAVFDRSLCRNVLFTAAQMENSRFRGSEMENVRFNHANLVGADFIGCHPRFRRAVGTHDHPFGIETVEAVMIGMRGAGVFSGHLDHAVTEPAALVRSLSRMVAVSREDGPNNTDFLRLWADARREAARAVLRHGHLAGPEEHLVLSDALRRLEHGTPPSYGAGEEVSVICVTGARDGIS